MHAIRADTTNRQLLNILRERPSSPGPKTYAVSYMETRTGSFAYTRDVLRRLMAQARAEVARLGGNAGVEAILDKLELGEPTKDEDREAMEKMLEKVVRSKPVKEVNGHGAGSLSGSAAGSGATTPAGAGARLSRPVSVVQAPLVPAPAPAPAPTSEPEQSANAVFESMAPPS